MRDGFPQLAGGRPTAFAFPFRTGRIDWRSTALAIIVTGGGAVAALYLTTRTSKGASATAIGMALFALIPAWMFSTRRVERALAIVVIYLGLFDGFLKLKTGSSNATLGRDVFLYAVVFGALLRATARGERWHWPPLAAWVLGWVAFVLVQVVNPSSGPILHRIASLRQDIEFVPLFFLGYAVVRSHARLRGLLVLLLAIAAVNGVVGLYQSSLSPDQLARWGSGYSDLIHGTHGAPRTAVGADGKPIVRPPALGGDMGFGGSLGMIALPGGIALLLTRRRSRTEMTLLGGLVLLTTMGIITSQSRSALISAAVGLIAFAAILAASREGRKVIVGIVLFTAVLGIAVSAIPSKSLHRYTSISPSKLAGTVTTSRASTLSLIPKYLHQYPFGAGIGSSGPAYGQFGAALNTVDGESQITFLIAEVGIPGLVLFVAFQFRVLAGAVRRLRQSRDSEARILLAGLVAPLFALIANWYSGINTTSSPNAPFLWGAIGVLAFWLLSGRASPSAASA